MSDLSAAELLALEQGSDSWLQARVGYASASEASSILAKGQGKMRAAYLRKMVSERLTGKPSESSANGAWAKNLERGKEEEPYARMAVEAELGVLIEEVGIIRHQTLMASCSPDGISGLDTGYEIKSVIPTVQIETILAGGYPSEHKAQLMFSLWITGRSTWWFCSYSPDMPENLRTYIFPVVRDDEYIAKLAAEVEAFLGEVSDIVAKLKAIK